MARICNGNRPFVADGGARLSLLSQIAKSNTVVRFSTSVLKLLTDGAYNRNVQRSSGTCRVDRAQLEWNVESGTCRWNVQIERADIDGACRWNVQIERADIDGTCRWNVQIERADIDGTCRWNVQIERADIDGTCSYRWNVQMERAADGNVGLLLLRE
jgi:hypothetical protein